MPLFLELIRQAAAHDADLARNALTGLRAYENAERQGEPPAKPEIARVDGACLRDHGGTGSPAILVPSLINPPRILDLDPETSLADAVSRMGRRSLLLDWGPASDRAALDVAAHVEELLLPLLRDLGEPAALIGYCLGGTMTLAAANLVPCERVVTLAAPWNFAGYGREALDALASLWDQSKAAAESLGALPMEVLQGAFWSLDPNRTVRKFADFGRLPAESPEARRFVALEDWANEGEPLPYPAARELIDDMFARNLPGRGDWQVGGRPMSDLPDVETLNVIAAHDRISPRAAAPRRENRLVEAGHVGMVVGSARAQLHDMLQSFLGPARH